MLNSIDWLQVSVLLCFKVVAEWRKRGAVLRLLIKLITAPAKRFK